MDELGRDQRVGCDLASKMRLALAAALMGAVLAACGGGGDSPAAAAPMTSGDGPATVAGAPPAPVAPPPAGAPPASGDAPASSGDTPPSSDESDGLAGVATAKGSTTLSWTPPTQYDDGTPLKLTGYRLYWGLTEGNYPHSVTLDNPGLTRYVVEELAPATWYFVATALSGDVESEFSNVLAMEVR